MLRSLKYGINGAVLAGLIAAPVVWMSADKTVDLVVDGQGHSVTTTADQVGQVLVAHGYQLTSHDIVAPAPSSSVHDGETIVLRRGRLLDLDIDGRSVQVWTTASTVSQALGQLGYTTADFVSVSRSQRLPLTATDIAIRTPRRITVVHDGITSSLTTTDPTVGQVLKDLGITVGPDDRLSAPLGSQVTDGQTIQVQRLTKKQVTDTRVVGFTTTKHPTASMDSGTSRVVTPGRSGKVATTYELVYLDGRLIGRTTIGSRTLVAAQTRVVQVGTRRVTVANTPAAPTATPGSAQAIAQQLLARRGWGSDQFSCLVQMWDRESGWSTSAANPSGAYGIPQALPGSKMASAGPDWQTDATTQITWGIDYIAERYGTPCGAWSFWQAHDYY